MLGSLEPSEIEKMLEEGGGEEVVCEVCAERYAITPGELRALLA